MQQDILLLQPRAADVNPLRLAGLPDHTDVVMNGQPAQLVKIAVANGEGVLTDQKALAVKTGKFTGRSPLDKFAVRDATTEHTIDWGSVNQPFDADRFAELYARMQAFVQDQTVYAQQVLVGAASAYQLRAEIITTKAWQSLFVSHLFLHPTEAELVDFTPDWTVLCVPEFMADPATDGTRQTNFTIVDFTRRVVLIGGTEYAGEIKKSMFTVMNYTLPEAHDVLPMHCSATVGKAGDVALFFGLSGTGKTTLSADPTRRLIGDDEHGWADTEKAMPGIFNMEGGCYAKVIKLNPAQEPRIFGAIRTGTVLENIGFYDGLRAVNYHDDTLTENTRAAYPLRYADPYAQPFVEAQPKHVFFLTADASGVLPPLASLTEKQAMAFFLTGYTSKLAGTEMGIVQPKPTFSPAFGAAFLPLPATRYADLLAKRIRQSGAKVWLVNTGWTGGGYGVGARMPLAATRALINAVLSGQLNPATWQPHPIFGVAVPTQCPGVADALFSPTAGWADTDAYQVEAQRLLGAFANHLHGFVGTAGVADLLEGAAL